MIDERQQELAALHALDLLEGDERLAFETELERNPDLRALARKLRESSAALAALAPQSTPRPELRSQLLSRIAAENTSAAAAIPHPAFRIPQFIPWLAAACFAVACAWLGQLYLTTRTGNAVLREQQTLAELELRSTRQQLEAERLITRRQLADSAQQLAQLDTELTQTRDRLAAAEAQRRREGDLAQFKIATLASLAGNSPEALAVAVWNPSTQQGVFKIEKMPLPGADQDYELWVIDPAQPTPVSAGVFAVGADGVARVQFRPESPVATVAKFAVSRERKGGAPRHSGPQGPVVMLSD